MPDRRPTRAGDTRRPRVLFAAGSGDVATTLRHWSNDDPDTRIMAQAYSAQVYSIAQEKSWRLFCIPNNPNPGARRGQIAALPFPKRPASGARYLIEEFRYGYAIAKLAQRLGADLIIVATGIHPVGHAAMAIARVPVLVSLHNTFWVRGESPPAGWRGKVLRGASRRLNRSVRRVVAVSEEIRRQTIELWDMDPDRVRVHVPQYDLRPMPWQARTDEPPHTILFAGRLEAYKGVDDILRAARTLEDEQPGRYRWTIAGDGAHLPEARRLADELGIGHIADFPGQLDRAALTERLKACHATITPTRPSFKEGLAKLPLEGAIVGRPAIVSTVVPALDLLGEAAEPVKPSDPGDIARAVRALSNDPDLYARRRKACRRIRDLVTDASLSFRARVGSAADAILNEHRTG